MPRRRCAWRPPSFGVCSPVRSLRGSAAWLSPSCPLSFLRPQSAAGTRRCRVRPRARAHDFRSPGSRRGRTGSRLAPRATSAHQRAVRNHRRARRPAGVFTVARRDHIGLPARMRLWCGMATRDRVLIAGFSKTRDTRGMAAPVRCHIGDHSLAQRGDRESRGPLRANRRNSSALAFSEGEASPRSVRTGDPDARGLPQRGFTEPGST